MVEYQVLLIRYTIILKIMTKKSASKKVNNEFEDMQFSQFREKILKNNYEESITQLDNILNQLQNESVPIDELKTFYIKGNILVEHCQNLLNNLEQEVLEIDSQDL